MRKIVILVFILLFQMIAAEEYFSQHDLCEYEISNAEKRYKIPNCLLMAIGTVESGRGTDKARTKRPWPWTVCAEGKSYYFSTKNAAIASVKKLMARGIRNIDVGCMQINLLHHSKAFKNLEEAFTPHNNVSYAARFFTELRNVYNSWTHAVGYYHSKSSKFYKPYCTSVYNTWLNVKGRAINCSKLVKEKSKKIKSDISFLPSYYALSDKSISAKLHELGRKTLSRRAPKFFTIVKK